MLLGNICCEGWDFSPITIFIIVIFLGIVFGWRSFRSKWMQDFCGERYGTKWMQDFCGDRYSTGTSESAIDILKKRYAKGEISKEEFDQMKKEL